MFSAVFARVTVRCHLVSQQKAREIVGNSLRQLLLVNINGNNKTQIARCSTIRIANEESIEAMSNDNKKPFRRLPSCVRPYHYDISLTPNLTTFTFDGIENVHLNVSLLPATIYTCCLCFSKQPISRVVRVVSIIAYHCICCRPYIATAGKSVAF
jgi:hypothetical protein